MKAVVICLLLVLCMDLGENFRILGLFPLPSQSHMVMFKRLMMGLAEKGHEVDVLSHFPQAKPVLRYTDFSVRGTLPIFVNNFSISFLQNELAGYYSSIKFILDTAGVENCRAVLNSSVTKQLKNTDRKYDLVITELLGSECMLGFGHHFQVPVISVTSSVNLPWGSDRIGNPDNPAYIANYFVPFSSKMSLTERFVNTVVLLASKLGLELITSYKGNAVAREFFGPDLPDLRELARNTSLILVNSHFSINQARPAVPNFIEVGGLHIGPQKPLPKHLEDSLNVTPQYKGVIYLSMGSMVQTETFPSYKLRALFEAFRELPYKVLWKAVRENMPKGIEIPPNILFEPWMPQLDILCHPNVKLFVTHGGLMGTQEAVYCAVPRLGIPLFADQTLNLKASENMGLAITVNYDDITKENILTTARKLLDPRYKNNAERVSKLFRDRPLPALETAIYWVEYVIRHRGAPHLRSIGADLLWYQYYLIDVGAIIVAFFLSFIIGLRYLAIVFQTLLFNRKALNKSKVN